MSTKLTAGNQRTLYVKIYCWHEVRSWSERRLCDVHAQGFTGVGVLLAGVALKFVMRMVEGVGRGREGRGRQSASRASEFHSPASWQAEDNRNAAPCTTVMENQTK
jgi:hypothetical protein